MKGGDESVMTMRSHHESSDARIGTKYEINI